MIESTPFFSRCDQSTKQIIVTALQSRVFTPLDIIAKEGDNGFEMFFLQRGRVTISTSQMSLPVITSSSKGDFFGECYLLDSETSCETVTACVYCEFYVLSQDDFKEIVESADERLSVQNSVQHYVNQKKSRYQKMARNLTLRPKCERLLKQKMGEKPRLSSMNLILPDSKLLLLWDTVLLSSCSFIAWAIPFRLAFQSEMEMSHFDFVIDLVIDSFFLFDMVLHFRFIAFIQNGKLVTDINKIKRHYKAHKLRLDLIAAVPLDTIARLVLPSRFANFVDSLKLLKLIRLGRQFHTVDRLFRELLDRGFNLAPLRLVEFLSGVVLIAHWAGCGFYAVARWKNRYQECAGKESSGLEISKWASHHAECLWSDTWIERQIRKGKLPTSGGATLQLYIRSFNWALPTLVVVVIGDVVPVSSNETLYAFIWMAIGVTVNAAIIGNVANIVSNLETDSADFAGRVDEIKSFMFKHRLSSSLHSRVDDFSRYLWSMHQGSTVEDDFIMSLPYTLQTAVLEHTRAKHIRCCPFFDFCSKEVVKALSLCLKPRVYCKGDIICHYGDMGQEMFFLDHGTVEVISADLSTRFATLHDGSFFGETALFIKQPRASTVCALSFCDILELTKHDFLVELRRRQINLSCMMELFNSIHNSNIRRNKAVNENLEISKNQQTKLSKLVQKADDSMCYNNDDEKAKVFKPYSTFRLCWGICCCALSIYTCVAVPYWVAFAESNSDEYSLIMINVLIDMFFMIDLYLRCYEFTFPANTQYEKSQMAVDFISCFALLDVMSYRLSGMKHFRYLCLLRISRIPSFCDEVSQNLNFRGIRISLAINLLCKQGLFYLMTNHWVACVWFIIHRYLERSEKFTWATTDCPFGGDVGDYKCLAKYDPVIGEHNICNLGSMVECYVRSFHFALTTLSTVGYGDISPVTEIETIWENCVVLTGACFMAGLIGAFGAYLSENDSLGMNAFRLKIQSLKNYMSYRNIPDYIQNEIFFSHHFRWQKSQGLDEHETLQILPEPLQHDISYEVKRRVLHLVPIFKPLPLIVQKRICHALIPQVYPKDSIIYSVGDIGHEILFIVSGVVTVTLPSDLSELDTSGKSNAALNKEKFEAIGKILSAGNHLGESCLNSNSGVRQETVISKTTVELYALSKDDLNGICRFMGSDKEKEFKESFLRRNGNIWHFFDDLPGMVGPDKSDNEEQDLLHFPWSDSAQSFNGSRRPTNAVRRRRLSQARRRSLSYSSRDVFRNMFLERRLQRDDQSSRSVVWDPGSPRGN